jgi:UDP-N-acetylmuramate--L-alanine ligase
MRQINLLGIGGSGMLPLAILLRQAGFDVQGSDQNLNDDQLVTLSTNGVRVVSNDVDANLGGFNGLVDCLVISPAIASHHPIVRRARRLNLPVVYRSQMLARLLEGRQMIGVAGSHGKSTTVGMLIDIFRSAGMPFGYMIGAQLADMPPARLGPQDSIFIFEACEAHGSLHDWHCAQAIVTSVDNEHDIHYGGFAELKAAFMGFVDRVPASGTVVVCGDDPVVTHLLRNRPSGWTYGFHSSNRLRLKKQKNGPRLNVPGLDSPGQLLQDGQLVGHVNLQVPGEHNELNAMAAFAMAVSLGVPARTALKALAEFVGVERRLQPLGSFAGVRVFDDYAHHPTEIRASLSAVRSQNNKGHVIAVLQPQLQSRIIEMATSFADSLLLADRCYLLPTERLGELNHRQDADSVLARACVEKGVVFEAVPGLKSLADLLAVELRDHDQVVIMAARHDDAIAQAVIRACRRQIKPDRQVSSILYGPRLVFEKRFVEVVRDRAVHSPSAHAVVMGHRVLSYADLMSQSYDLMCRLCRQGVNAGDAVGVYLRRSVDRVVAFFAILRAGAVYVPIDPDLPSARVAMMLEDVGACVMVVNTASPALPDMELPFINVQWDQQREAVPSDFDLTNPLSSTIPNMGLAYVIFTSGTTGRPKGVEVGHDSLTNYAAAVVEHFQVNTSSRVSLVSAFGFDVSVGDMAMALYAGACLVMPTDIQATHGAALGRFLADSQLTHLSTTPSLLSTIPQDKYPVLGTVIVAGEPCYPELVEKWAHGRVFINAYGPTEATVESTYAVCEPGELVSIGRPIANMGACVVDRNLQVLPLGYRGELCLFGVGLARGYVRQPALTHERFVSVTLPDGTTHRMYLTGDEAVLEASGHLTYLGRNDGQVKFHGFRIELAEIELVLSQFYQVQRAVVSLVDTPVGERLVGYVVLQSRYPSLDQSALKAHMSDRLPAYMHPAYVLALDAMPLTRTGKLDRASLPPVVHLSGPIQIRLPKTSTEKRLAFMVSEMRGDQFIFGVRDSLSNLGFDSLGLAVFLHKIEIDFDTILEIAVDADVDTLETIGMAVDAAVKPAGDWDLSAGGSSTVGSSAAGIRAANDEANELANVLRPHLATWPGVALGHHGLVRRIHSPLFGANPTVFWCFQGGPEFEALNEALGAGVDLFGLRSGHLVLDYDERTLKTLSSTYADEIERVHEDLRFRGHIILGGNCQGGLIMAEVSKELRRRGRQVSLTVLMEQGRFTPLAGQVLLLFGDKSYLNPYAYLRHPEHVFGTAYPDGYATEMLPGGHGQYFQPINVKALATILSRYIERTCTHG